MADAGVTGAVLAELRDEGDSLEGLVAGLDASAWTQPTPAAGWTVAHQIAHLAWTDEQAVLAATDEQGFLRSAEAAAQSPQTFVDDGAAQVAARPPRELLAHWRKVRAELPRALAGLPEGQRMPWYGPPMSAASMGTARLMETWAHGEDVAAALGVLREPTARLRHIARLGVRTRDFAYGVHGMQPPAHPFRVELTGPGGDMWTYGPEEAAQRVTGDASDFCRLVAQRLHRDDARLRAEGRDAEEWLGIAQVFAGPPGRGRPRAGAERS